MPISGPFHETQPELANASTSDWSWLYYAALPAHAVAAARGRRAFDVPGPGLTPGCRDGHRSVGLFTYTRGASHVQEH